MPRRKSAGPASTIPQQLTQAAQTFAREILRILGTTTLSNLNSLGGVAAPTQQVSRRILPKEAGEPESPRRQSKRTSALRRIAGARPVQCPVPGCENTGVRSKMNFCREHASSLPQVEKVQLRQEQRATHVAEPVQAADSGKETKRRGKKKS